MEEILLAGNVALRVVDGVILPHLKMTEQSDRCSFLNEEGRCSIHDARPASVGCFRWVGCMRMEHFLISFR